jgi:hypothetical protein
MALYAIGSAGIIVVFGRAWARLCAVFWGFPEVRIFQYPISLGSPPVNFFLSSAVEPFFLVAWVAIGWVVARTHRACAGAAIFAMTILGTPWAIQVHPWIWMVNVMAFAVGALLDARQRDGFAERT